MNLEEKIDAFRTMLGDEEEDELVISTYLNMAKERILNHRFPFGRGKTCEVEEQYDYLQVELAVTLYNQRGAEGEERHSENGVARTWRTTREILQDIPRRGGIPQ